MTTCIECPRTAIRNRERCQRCERRAVQGPVHQPSCLICRDKGRIELGGCDIPGCRHWRPCDCVKK